MSSRNGIQRSEKILKSIMDHLDREAERSGAKMADNFYSQLVEAVRQGDVTAAKILSDYLKDQGKQPARYILRVDGHHRLSDEQVKQIQDSFGKWINNEVPVLIMPMYGVKLAILAGNDVIPVAPFNEGMRQHWENDTQITEWFAKFVNSWHPEVESAKVGPLLSIFLFTHDLSIIGNEQLADLRRQSGEAEPYDQMENNLSEGISGEENMPQADGYDEE